MDKLEGALAEARSDLARVHDGNDRLEMEQKKLLSRNNALLEHCNAADEGRNKAEQLSSAHRKALAELQVLNDSNYSRCRDVFLSVANNGIAEKMEWPRYITLTHQDGTSAPNGEMEKVPIEIATLSDKDSSAIFGAACPSHHTTNDPNSDTTSKDKSEPQDMHIDQDVMTSQESVCMHQKLSLELGHHVVDDVAVTVPQASRSQTNFQRVLSQNSPNVRREHKRRRQNSEDADLDILGLAWDVDGLNNMSSTTPPLEPENNSNAIQTCDNPQVTHTNF
eukprot:GHVO01011395.1.p1 GENE.GHVO01011395.1~~GHVO01011395.1.p1  ORF type:complete len:279 (-),score=37.25 GHVO01011395.1:573-1409(-)